MKYIIILIAILSAFSITNGKNYWIQKDGYQELNWNTDPLLWNKISPDGKYLYSMTNKNKIIKIDIETGDTIKSWIKSYAIADLNTEDESVLTFDCQTVKKIKLDNDSIEFTVYPKYADKYRGIMNAYSIVYSCGLKISNDCKTFIVMEQLHCVWGGSIIEELTGQIEINDMKTGDSLYLVQYWDQPVETVYGQNQHIAFTTYYYLELDNWPEPPTTTYKNLISLDSNKKIALSGGYKTNENVSNLSFSKNDDILLGSASSKISLWDVATGNYVKSVTSPVYNDFTGQFYFLKWTGNSNVFLHSYSLVNNTDTSLKKSIILIYHKDFTVPIDSLLFDGINQNYSYCIGPDSTSFFTISQSNIIRWFKPDFLTANLKAYFISDRNISLPGDSVKFIDLSRGNPDTWLWDFGDGTAINVQNPIHIFTKSGAYNIQLIVGKNGTNDTLIKNKYILVNSNLKADFEPDITTGDPPLTVNFKNKSIGDIKSYYWDFGDGLKDTTKNPVHKYVNPGIYSVVLIVFDGTYRDTLAIKDLIHVNRKSISDTSLNKELVLGLQYTNLYGTAAFNVEDGYFAEGYSSTQNTVLKIDNLLSTTISIKSLYTNSFHRPMQKAGNGFYYFIGDSIYNNLIVQLNRCSKYLDDYKQFYGAKFGYLSQLFDYSADTNGIYINYNNSIDFFNRWDIITMRRLDNFGKINMTQTGILSSGDSDIATSLKVFKFPGYGSVMGISSHSYSRVNGDKYLRGIVSSDTVNNYLKWLIGIMSQNVFGKISDICYLPTNSIITLENNSLYITKWQGNFTNFVYEPFLTKPGITIKSINVISPTSILLSGSNNGYCWYGFINYAGTTTVEHTIYERPGTFCTSNVNPDKSILFSGLLNKNHNENYLYLYLTKPIIMGREDTITQKELVIFPNPANDELCVKTTFDFSIPKKIKIYDYYGDNVLTKEVNQTGQDYIRIDLSGLNMGVYYIQLEYDTKVAYQKFIIIR